MGSLFTTLSIALGGLQAQQAGLQTTTNNLANLSTPGYSRERPLLEESDPIVSGNLAYGGGVQLKGIQSLRDRILDLQISDETAQQAQSQSYVNVMNEVQALFPTDTTGIGNAISTFFSSLNSLSTNPSDTTLRQQVLSAAGNLATAFRGAAAGIVSERTNVDLNAQQDVSEINQLTQQIADVNSRLANGSSTGQDYGTFLDQRNQLVQQLSGLIDVSEISSGNSLTLTTRQGTALVADGQSFALSTAPSASDGMTHIFSQGRDMTREIASGKLGGLLAARDHNLPDLQGQLDTLASGLVNALNAAHQAGFDLNGNPGGNLFTAVAGAGAAASMTAAINDPRLLAASSDGSAGSNGNLANLSAVATKPVADGMTPTQAYGNLVFQVGSAIANGNAELTASQSVLGRLQQQSASVSGVSLDEEASNLMLYQRAYQAAARAISAVDQMLQTAINLGVH